MNWYTNYLSNRYQYTEVNGVLSNKTAITLGVPQGTVLGPLLYLIYTHDLPNATILKALLFADDTTLIATAKTISELHDLMQKEINSLHNWFVHNKLTLNVKKSKLMYFYEKGDPITINNTTLDTVEEFKLVGVTLTHKLTWDTHAKTVCKKISSACYFLNKLRHRLDTHNKLLIYHSLVNSHISYALPIWQGMTQKMEKQLISKQNGAVRAVFNLHYRESTKEVLKLNNVLNLTQTMCYTTLLLVKSTKQPMNPHLSNLFPSKAASNLRSGSRNLLFVPKTSTKNAQQQSSFIAPSIWNVHDETIKQLPYASFREATKKLILETTT